MVFSEMYVSNPKETYSIHDVFGLMLRDADVSRRRKRDLKIRLSISAKKGEHVAAHNYQLFDSSYCPTRSSRDMSTPAADVHTVISDICVSAGLFFFSAKTVSFQFTTRNENNLQANKMHANDNGKYGL